MILAEAEYYIRLIDKFRSLEKALDHIGNVLPDKWHQKKRTWSFNLLIRHYGKNDEECTERALSYLRTIMKTGVKFVEQLSDRPLQNGTNCFWAKRGVEKTRNGNYKWPVPKCDRKLKRCRIDEFFEENSEAFLRIKHEIDRLPKARITPQLAGFSMVIGEALVDPKVLLDYKSGCQKLADAIIAVDSIAYKNFFSQNKAESEILAPLFDQDFYYLPPNFEQGVLVQLAVPDRPTNQE